MKLAIFASGVGSNFTAIQEAIKEGKISGELAFLFCDNKQAQVIERARKENVPTYVFEPREFPSKIQFEKAIVALLDNHEIDLVILAGYMRLIGMTLLSPYQNKIVNIHPSILPKYPGTKSIQEAFEKRESYSGVTIHLIDEGIDTGPVIAQEKVYRGEEDTLESFEKKIHELEHILYPKVIQQILKERG